MKRWAPFVLFGLVTASAYAFVESGGFNFFPAIRLTGNGSGNAAIVATSGDKICLDGDTCSKYVSSTASVLPGVAVDGGTSAESFTATAASGSNGFACQVNGCRVDFGAGANDYASSNGTAITFATGVNVSGALGVLSSNVKTTGAGKVQTSQGAIEASTDLANQLTTVGAGSGSDPTVTATGSDTDVSMALNVKGAGSVKPNARMDFPYEAAVSAGNVTLNKPAFQAQVDAAAASVVVTNSYVKSGSAVVLCSLQTTDATCTGLTSIVPGAGSVTVSVNAACTAATKVACLVVNP